jgi:hypothetical protein
VRRFTFLSAHALLTHRSKSHHLTRTINNHKTLPFSPVSLFHEHPPTISRPFRCRKHILRPPTLHRRLSRNFHRAGARDRFAGSPPSSFTECAHPTNTIINNIAEITLIAPILSFLPSSG